MMNASQTFDTFVNRHLQGHRLLTSIVVLGVAVYISIFLEMTPSYVIQYLDSPITKVAVIALAITLINPNPTLAIAITLCFFAVLQVVKQKKIFENFDSLTSFYPSMKPDFASEYRAAVRNSGNLVAHGESTKGVFSKLFPQQPAYTQADAIWDAGEQPWFSLQQPDSELQAIQV